MFQNLKLLLRGMRRTWLSSGFALAVLGVSVGATAAVYTVMDALVIHPLPIDNPSRVVHLSGLALETPNGDAAAWWGSAHSLERIAFYSAGGVSVGGDGGSRWNDAAVISVGFFQVFGAVVAPGRSFGPEDELPGQNRVVILSHSFWSSYFGGRTSAIGSELTLNGVKHTVVGIAPEGFAYPIGTSLWTPREKGGRDSLELLRSTSLAEPLRPGFHSVGRLRDGATLEETKAELGVLLKHLNDEYTPKTHLQYGDFVSVHDFRQEFVRNFGPALNVLLGGTVLILVVAAINYCIFLAAQAARRRKEFAVRRALGAGSAHILRQTLTEAAALATASALIGLAAAEGLLVMSRQTLPFYLIHLREHRSIAFLTPLATFLLAFFVSVLVNLIPMIDALSQGPSEALKHHSGPLTSAHGRMFRRVFVALQVSLSFVLAVGAILSLQTFLNLSRSDTGYDMEHVFAAHLNVPVAQFCQESSVPPQRDNHDDLEVQRPKVRSAAGGSFSEGPCRNSLGAWQNEVLRAAGALPFVSAVGLGEHLPISPPVGGPWVKHNEVERWCTEAFVSSGYFRAFQVPFIAGRAFTNSAEPEVIISESTARAFWHTGNPLGDMLLIEGENRPRRVVAVVKSTRSLEIGEQPAPQIYVPLLDRSLRTSGILSTHLVVRCENGCGGVLVGLIDRLKSVGADVFVDQAASVSDLGAVVTAPVRARSLLLTSYAFLGFGLALVGVFVLVSYVSVLREQEIGIRMALGAQPTTLALMVAKEGIVSAGVGVLAGGVGSLAAVQVLRSLLFGVEVLDMRSFSIAGILLLAGAICAALISALRVTAYQPSDLLRVA